MDMSGNAYEWLSKITYKPGWKFELEEERTTHHLYNLMYFRLTTKQPSADGSVDHAFLCSTHGISPEAFMDRDHFLMIVEHAIRDAEMHEVDEWLKYDGKHIRDPHPVVNNAIGKKALTPFDIVVK